MNPKLREKQYLKNKRNDTGKYWPYYAAGIVLATFIVLSAIPSADFVNWDDPDFLLNNDLVKSLSLKNIGKMFTVFSVGNYSPLVTLSYALDYHIAGGFSAKVFHTSALLIHCINTLLVFLFIYRLSGNQVMIASVASLLFGIHPMHVESVAWVAERRDLLYTLFYLAGLIYYLGYIKGGRSIKHLLFSFLFFILSLFSKGQAVTFPVVLFVLDYVNERKFNRKIVIEKIPFFLLALVFGIVSIVAIKTTEALSLNHVAEGKSFFVGSYGVLLYLTKAVIPFNLSGFHPYPSGLPLIAFLAPLLIIFLILVVWIKLKSDRNIVGGLLIFFVTILPVAQFIPEGPSINPEHYSYIPYIGLFFAMGCAFHYPGNYQLLKPIKSYAGIILIVYLAILCYITTVRVQIWQNTTALWTDVLKQYPDCKIAYTNRGMAYNKQGQFKLAVEDFNNALALDSADSWIYMNRGLSYDYQNSTQQAVHDFNKAIELDSLNPLGYLNRANLYFRAVEDYDSAIRDYKKTLSLDPENTAALNNMGVSYFKKKDFMNAVLTYSRLIELNHEDGKVYYYRALAYGGKEEFDKAISDFQRGRELGYPVDDNLINQYEQLKQQAGGK